jgi:hypothetical protein
MNQGTILTLWSVRIAVLGYVIALWLRIRGGGESYYKLSRLYWSAGCFALLIHVAFAFHFYHGWSHLAAWESTAKETRAVTGLNWGGGVYVNYLFAAVWGADVFWWWVRPQSYQNRHRIVEWSVQGFLAFILFNATVVFGNGAIRWGGLWTIALFVRYWLCKLLKD